MLRAGALAGAGSLAVAGARGAGSATGEPANGCTEL